MSVFEGLSLPKVIYRTGSDINKEIEVLEMDGTRRLRVDKVTQSVNADSPLARKLVWGRAVDLIKEEMPDLDNILVMGMGGGTVQHLLAKDFPDIYIVSVEIDSEIVDVAKRFFDVDKIPNHRIINDDACRLVIEPEKYDLGPQAFSAVYIDIFVGKEYPDLGASGNFLASVCKLLIPGGLVVVNRIYLEEHQEDVDVFIENLKLHLRNVQSVIIPGKTNADNMLIFGRI